MLQKVKVLPPSRLEAHYVENDQTHSIRFAFTTKKEDGVYQLLHKPARCRDFFSDVIYSQRSGKATGDIYGFRWNPKEEHTDKDKTRFCLDSFLGVLAKNLPILNEIECANGLEPSVLILGTLNEGDCAIIEGDKRWMCSTFLISLYTYLIRAMTYEFSSPDKWLDELSKNRGTDGSYLKRVGVGIFSWIISNLTKFGMKEDSLEFASGFKEKNTSFDSIHGYCGWYCLSMYRKKEDLPYSHHEMNIYSQIIGEAEEKAAA